jgi:acetolactate synthase-1/2/3 large subunit
MARGLLGAEHSLQLRHKRKEALADADFILLAGSIVDFRVDYGRHFAKHARVVMVNLGLEALGKNSDIRARQQAVRADPCAFVVALAQQHSTAKVSSTWTPWLQKLRQNDARRETEIDKMAAASSAAKNALGLNPVRVCRAINQAMAEDSIIVADGGDFVGTASYTVRPRQPHGWLDPGVFGTLGVGGGFAVAAKALRPKSEVWILFGDGSCAWSLSEVDTMVRHQLPCIIVIGNDAAWQQMRRDQVRLLGDPVASELLFTRYDTVGAGYGAHGILVDRESDLETALSEAKRVVRDERRPVVVNVMIAKSSFREGSISL